MNAMYDVDGGNAVLEVGRMLSGIEPDGLRRAGDEARLGQATTLFTRAVRHVVHGGATKRGDLVPIAQPSGDSAAPVATVKVGDTFRWIGGQRHGSICEVTDLDGAFAIVSVPAFGGCDAADGQRFARAGLLDPKEFECVRAVEAPPVRAEVGSTLGLGGLADALFGPLPGVYNSAADRAAANPALAAAVLGPDPDDLHGPAGDAVVALTLPGAIAMQQDLLEQIRKLIPTSRAYAASLDSYDPYQDVADIVAALAQSIGYDRKGGL